MLIFIVIPILLLMISTYIWFLSISDDKKYPKGNKILWTVLTIGFILIMASVLVGVIFYGQ